ncbi:ParA family protein [Candidatus Chloroploca sp. M-50]|uniref:ParA family protein n=1 Tax=Candidatus Chloroploca mongolica TaxID=2528176 RepID=A0ABS4DH89_9CHLR|nr:ParA family protein [Candidatus Chloroploca mongolica]MBP1468795.1 ParA family protein [Candidatus Chloroploca mongolica]
MTYVYALANEKGGVGKTSVAVNLAVAFAKLDVHVLLIDLDAQRHASRWLGIDTNAHPVDASFLGIVVERRRLDECVIRTAEGVDVIPAHKDMIALPESLGRSMGGGIYTLRKALARAETAGYRPDIVILDLAPARGPVLATALAAATRCIAPVQAADLVLQSLGDLVDSLTQAQEFNPDLRGLSVLRNNYTLRANLDFAYDEALGSVYAATLLKTIIPSRALIRLASGAQQSVFAFHGPEESAVRSIFLSLAEELLTLDGALP